MADTREPQSLIDSADQAAKAGDYAAAERLLREAADLQESGPPAQRAELANTLNNLGVVCELTDNPVEAERCFRRAYEIAVEVLEPGHAFVTTSRKNLEDFCRANGKEPFPDGEPRPSQTRAAPTLSARPDDGVTAPPLTDLLGDFLPASPAPAPSPPPPAVTLRATPPPPPPAPPPGLLPSATSSRPLAIGLVAVAIVLGLFLARSLFFRDTGTRDAASVTASSDPAAAPASPEPSPAPAPTPPPASEPVAAPPPAPVDRAPAAQPKETAPAKSAPPAAKRSAAPSNAPGSISLVNGAVCRNLRTGGGEWRCDPAGSSVGAGQLYFYTRVKSERAAVVQHRWYRGSELRKSIDLEIAANPGQGYRTYSRNTVSAGDWRVELRTKSGDVLHEERFTVR
jgi:hypothetical protein